MRKLLALLLLTTSASAADLTVKPYTQTWAPGFVYCGIAGAASIDSATFDSMTGAGSVQFSGARAGTLCGYEVKGTWMIRGYVQADYDFARGTAFVPGGFTQMAVAKGGALTEGLDLGYPLAWLGGVTPFLGVGVSQDQFAGSWGNRFVARGGIDIPAGPTSIGVLYKYEGPGRSVATPFGPINSNPDYVIEVNWKVKL